MLPALYLLPVTLGDTPVETVLPSYNKEVILGIRYFIVEDVRSARRFLKKVDREIDIDSLTFYTLNKHTSPEARIFRVGSGRKIKDRGNRLDAGKWRYCRCFPERASGKQ